MDYKHACVVDARNIYKTFVLVFLEPNRDGDVRENIQSYSLLEGEKLVDAAPPSGFVKPCWDGKKWVEAAKRRERKEANSRALKKDGEKVFSMSPTDIQPINEEKKNRAQEGAALAETKDGAAKADGNIVAAPLGWETVRAFWGRFRQRDRGGPE